MASCHASFARMNLTGLSLIAEVARLGSFAAVARARGTDPSQVSRAVSAIEADLGLRLFQRTTRSLSLTEEGDGFLARVLPLMEEMERLTTEARSIKAEPQGLLRLTASVTFGQAIL